MPAFGMHASIMTPHPWMQAGGMGGGAAGPSAPFPHPIDPMLIDGVSMAPFSSFPAIAPRATPLPEPPGDQDMGHEQLDTMDILNTLKNVVTNQALSAEERISAMNSMLGNIDRDNA